MPELTPSPDPNQVLGVSPSGANGEDAQFDNLWLAQLICCFMPLISIAALPLIPHARQTKNIDVDWGRDNWRLCGTRKGRRIKAVHSDQEESCDDIDTSRDM